MYTWIRSPTRVLVSRVHGATCRPPRTPPNLKAPRTPENRPGKSTWSCCLRALLVLVSRHRNFSQPTMMNLAAIALLLCSLATAGVFEPKPPNDHAPQRQGRPGEPLLVREGHRLVVVEYEHRVADEASRAAPRETTHRLIEEAKGKFQEAAEILPSVGQGISMPEVAQAEEPKAGASHSVKDVVCDAYGVCKEKLSSLVGRGKDKLSEKASDVEEGFKDAAKKVADKAGELRESTKDVAKGAKEKATELEEGAKDTMKEAVDKASEVKDATADAIRDKASKAKERVKGTAEMAKERAKQAKEGAKDAMEKAVDSIKETGEDLSSNVSGMTKKAAESTGRTTVELRRNLTDIVRRARDVGYDAAMYVWPPGTGRATAAILQLLGFGIAYGTCVWVTFVSSHVLAMALPRQQFGMVQSKLYPVYFRAVAYSIALTFLGHFFGRDRKLAAERIQGYNLLGSLGLVLVNMLYLEPQATKVMYERMKMEKEEGRGRDMADVIAEPAAVPVAAAGASPATTTTTTTATTTTTTTTARASDGMAAAKSTVSPEQEAAMGRMVKLNRKLRRLNNYSSLLNVMTLMSLTWHLVHLSRQLQVSC